MYVAAMLYLNGSVFSYDIRYLIPFWPSVLMRLATCAELSRVIDLRSGQRESGVMMKVTVLMVLLMCSSEG